MGGEIRRKAKVVHKHETAANWTLSSYVPEIGEIVFYDPDNEFEYTRQKNGDGIHTVSELPFITDYYIEKINTSNGIYATNANGLQTLLSYSVDQLVSSIVPVRDIAGALNTGMPSLDTHAIPKGYFE